MYMGDTNEWVSMQMGHAFCEAMLHYCDPDPVSLRHFLSTHSMDELAIS